MSTPRPEKPCATCGRPMQWRRRWAKVWDEVRHCSERCRRERKKRPAAPAQPTSDDREDSRKSRR